MTSAQFDLIKQTQALVDRVRTTGQPDGATIGHARVLGLPVIEAMDIDVQGYGFIGPTLHVDGVVLIGMPRS